LKIAAIFLLVVGCLWGLFVVWMLLTIAGIADPPESLMILVSYWIGMLFGPLTIITGSVMSLRKISSRTGPILVVVGCLALTGFALYNTIAGIQQQPLQAPPPYAFFIVLLLMMVLSDIAAYKIFKRSYGNKS
jgi:hypothetical protein